MELPEIKNIVEACLLVAGKPLSITQIDALFADDDRHPERSEIKAALESLQADYEGRGIELVEVASGWRLQSRETMAHWVARLFPERAPRYSRAFLETLVLIAYRQPITRGEIEEIRGVAVNSNIIKTLQEREWIKEVGHKEVPGRPALLGTTRQFLDYFNLKRLEDLPPLDDVRDLDEIEQWVGENPELAASMGIEVKPPEAIAEEEAETTAETESAVAAPPEQEQAQEQEQEQEHDAVAGEVTSLTTDDPLNVDPVAAEASGEPPVEQTGVFGEAAMHRMLGTVGAEAQRQREAREALDSKLDTMRREEDSQASQSGGNPQFSDETGENAEHEVALADGAEAQEESRAGGVPDKLHHEQDHGLTGRFNQNPPEPGDTVH